MTGGEQRCLSNRVEGTTADGIPVQRWGSQSRWRSAGGGADQGMKRANERFAVVTLQTAPNDSRFFALCGQGASASTSSDLTDSSDSTKDREVSAAVASAESTRPPISSGPNKGLAFLTDLPPAVYWGEIRLNEAAFTTGSEFLNAQNGCTVSELQDYGDAPPNLTRWDCNAQAGGKRAALHNRRKGSHGTKEVPGGVSAEDGGVGPSRSESGGAGEGVRAVTEHDPEVGNAVGYR